MGQNHLIPVEEHPSVIIIRVKSREQIEKLKETITANQIDCFPFYEPLFDNEMTAFATIPLSEDQQILLKKYQLIKAIDFCLKEDL